MARSRLPFGRSTKTAPPLNGNGLTALGSQITASPAKAALQVIIRWTIQLVRQLGRFAAGVSLHALFTTQHGCTAGGGGPTQAQDCGGAGERSVPRPHPVREGDNVSLQRGLARRRYSYVRCGRPASAHPYGAAPAPQFDSGGSGCRTAGLARDGEHERCGQNQAEQQADGVFRTAPDSPAP